MCMPHLVYLLGLSFKIQIRSCPFFAQNPSVASCGSQSEPSHGRDPPSSPAAFALATRSLPDPRRSPSQPHTRVALCLEPSSGLPLALVHSHSRCCLLGGASPVTLSSLTQFTSFTLSGFFGGLFIVCLLSLEEELHQPQAGLSGALWWAQ